jgi:signal transduction histidine kinase
VEDYLTKPFDTEEVVIAVRSRLERAEAIREASEMEFEEIKQEIVNVLSHELRTPLTYISGYTELALEDASSLSTEDLISFLNGIKKGADRLKMLVENLLLGVQIDTGRCAEEFQTFAKVQRGVENVVQHVVDLYEPQARKKGIQINADIPKDVPPVKMYRPFLLDALGRVLDNAIKFSVETPSEITVKVDASAEWVNIAISDQGVGIQPENRERIFNRLQQVDRDRTEQQGTGMGLFICKAMIDLHGGTIDVESEIDKGSTFTLHLPVAD